MMMKRTTLTCCLAIVGAVTLSAQSSETTTKTKVEIKNGKDVTVTGCVEADSGNGQTSRPEYVLTHVADKTGALHTYILVSEGDNFAKLIGQRVQIEGTVADRGHGKVEIKTDTRADGPAKDTHSKIEESGPYLGVKHMKKIAASCP